MRDEGRHGGDDTRRTRKGPKEPPRHVGLEAISAVSDARPLRAAVHGTGRRGRVNRVSSTVSPSGSVGLSTGRPHRRARSGRPSGPWPDRATVTWPSNPVSTSRPPTRSAAVTTSEWAIRQATVPSGSRANVSTSAWTRTWASRDEPRRATSGVAERCSQRGSPVRGLEPVGVEPVGDDQQAGRVPEEAARLVVDERGEAGRPRAARSLEAQLGAAQRVRVGGDRRAEVDQRSPPASDSAKTAGPEPLPPQRQRARRPPG